MNPEQIVSALQKSPLLTLDAMHRALDDHREARGLYAWWLVNSETMPGVPTPSHPSERRTGLLYVGIGPNSARSRRTLRQRFDDHTRRNTGSSTFRLVLAAFLFERQGWRPHWTDRPMLSPEDNDALSTWQAKNLRCQWIAASEPWNFEAGVIAEMRPPLNRDYNHSHPFYPEVGRARARYRAAARANPANQF